MKSQPQPDQLSHVKNGKERESANTMWFMFAPRGILSHIQQHPSLIENAQITNNLRPPALITKSNANLLARQGNVEDCLALDVHLLLDERILFGFLAKP